MEKKRIVFLLGAGFSKNFGLPDAKELTDIIFKEFKGVQLELLEEMRRYLEEVGGKSNNQPNYEDVYEAFETAAQAATLEYGTPIAQLFRDGWYKRASCVLDCFDNTGQNQQRNDFSLIAAWDKSIRAVFKEIIVKELSNKTDVTCPARLKWIKDVLVSDTYAVTLATLNHDLVLEECLTALKRPFRDGFGVEGAYLNIGTLLEDSEDIPIIKLHGSVNWVADKSDNERFFPPIRKCDPASHIGQHESRIILVGTMSKFKEYTQGVFFEALSVFHQNLLEADALIVIGYGFRDQGINDIIRLVLDGRSNGFRCYVMDPCPESIQEQLIRLPEGGAWPNLSSIPQLNFLPNVKCNLQATESFLAKFRWNYANHCPEFTG